MNWVGARWWTFDFHTHTPASFDYGRGDLSAKQITHRDWLLSFINKGIQCVAVTDHNSGEWIGGLQVAANILRSEGNTIHVFPGVEITANSNVHILAIFDPSTTSANIDAIIGAARFRGTRGDSDAVSEESPELIVEEIRKSGGIAIPAHIDSKAGLCQLTSIYTIEQTAKKSSAVEVIFPNVENQTAPLSRYRNLKLNLPEVVGSDSHHANEVGRAFTWVKMGVPSIEGLKLALVDGMSSIRRSDQVADDPNKTSSMLLRSLSVTNAKYAGRSNALTINFNPWLNSIIGGRGSGKSSLLEFIRIGMDRSKDLLSLPVENDVRRVFQQFIQKSVGRDSEGVMLDETEINCVYSKLGVDFLLNWKFSSQAVALSKWDGVNWVPEFGSSSARFPIKIFSQKQIFNLAKNPNTLLKLIDDSEFVDYAGWLMKWDEKKNQFLRLCGEKRELDGKVQTKFILLGQLSDVEQKIALIERSGHAQVLQDYQNAVTKSNAISTAVAYLNEVKVKFDTLAKSTAPPPPPQFGNSLDSELQSKYMEIVQALGSMLKEVNLSLSVYDQKLEAFNSWYAQSETFSQVTLSTTNYNNLIASLAAGGVTDPGEYGRLLAQRSELQSQINNIALIETQQRSVVDAMNATYSELVGLRSSLSQRRAGFLKAFIKQNTSISVELEPFENGDEIDSSFRKIIGRMDSSFSSDIFDADRQSGILLKLSQDLHGALFNLDSEDGLRHRLDVIYQFKTDLLNFNSGKVLGVGIGKRFIDFVSQLSPQTFDNLALWFPEDRLILKYHDGHRLKDISQGSAGQKAAAILTFLLSYGEEPLLLDQPEDDLDNGLITSMIVSKLQESKSKRQIFVVTHNPNIVVNADSDLVIALQSKGQIEVLASGPLQDAGVRRNVCEIMEGGELALQQRYRRMFNI